MAYTNSSLATYKKLSPYKNDPKNSKITSRVHSTYNPTGKITKITIHHMAGNLSVETCGRVFQTSGASANYGIGSDGRVGLYVEEKDRSWASASPSNDYKAVTIEVANCKGKPNWEVNDTAYNKLIDLCVDICKRNGIKKLNFTGDASGNLTMHRYFIATTCPGPYLKGKFQDIANEVNKRLGASSSSSSSNSSSSSSSSNSKVDVDGQWGVDTTTKTQKYFGTTQDGIVSSQLTSCKKYLPNAHSGSWRFVSNGSGSPMIKKLQSLVGATADGLAGQDTVKKLQTYLKKRGLYTGDIDGIMGSGTVKGWQKFINNPSKYEKVTSSSGSSTSSSASSSKKVVTEDGVWGVSTTKYTQKLMGTTQDGIVSAQRKAAKKYLPAAHTGSWQFNKFIGGGSPMIKKLQAYIGMTSKECDGLFGTGSIKKFQTFLKNKGYYTGSVDGILGTGTAKAWQKYLNSQF